MTFNTSGSRQYAVKAAIRLVSGMNMCCIFFYDRHDARRCTYNVRCHTFDVTAYNECLPGCRVLIRRRCGVRPINRGPDAMSTVVGKLSRAA
jgi:hypothetical protein